MKQPSLLIALALSLFGCDAADACKSKAACTREGKCSADAKGVCAVTSDDDCKGSEACKLHGKCGAKAGQCVATTDEGCKASDDCKKTLACSAYNGVCEDPAKTVHAECTKSCTEEGACVMSGGKCAALSRRHCAGVSKGRR